MKLIHSMLITVLAMSSILAGVEKKLPDAAGNYNAARDFLDKKNPSGPWSYGWKRQLDDNLTLFTTPKIHTDMTVTSWDADPNRPPAIACNTGNQTIYPDNTVIFKPKQIILHPGPGGEYSIVRWTAPEDGAIQIKGNFTGASGHNGAAPTTTDVHIRIGKKEVFGGSINLQGNGNDAPFDLKANVKKGEFVEFAVGYGNGNYTCDSTVLDATVQTSFPVLRGRQFDLVELRIGDQIKGTLLAKSFKLNTFYGMVELPAEKVLGIINSGEYHSQQLLVTDEGEIIGGNLQQADIAIALSTGQQTRIPLEQIARIGYRKRIGEGEDQRCSEPFVLLKDGQQLRIQMPAASVEFMTRCGKLTLEAKAISSMVFQAEQHGVHELQLVDGTHLTGLATAGGMEVQLAGGGSAGRKVLIPLNSLQRVQLSKPISANEKMLQLKLVNGDTLVGNLNGPLTFESAYETLTINGSDIRRISRVDGSDGNVQITLSNQRILTGQFQVFEIPMQLGCGVVMKVPINLIDTYGGDARKSAKPTATAKVAAPAAGNADWSRVLEGIDRLPAR